MKEAIIQYEDTPSSGLLAISWKPLVRCKDCKWRDNKKKCIVAFIAAKQDFPIFFYDNSGEWFCADGER